MTTPHIPTWLIYLLVIGGGFCLILGTILVVQVQGALKRRELMKASAQYPRDWPDKKEFVSSAGYSVLKPSQVLKDDRYQGAFRLGQLYPRWAPHELIPDVWPLSRLREKVAIYTLSQIWVPERLRYEHFGVIGPTGAGKSTGFIFPMLAFGAYEKDTSAFVIDVKSPEFARMFAKLYRDAGKDFYFFDPFRPQNTLGFEPLWRASEGQISELAEVISTYSDGQGEDSKNSGFFKENAKRSVKTFLSVAQFWPRRYCTIPSVSQWLMAGNEAIEDGVDAVGKFLHPYDRIMDAIRVIVPATKSELRALPRDPKSDLTQALEILDCSGYQIAAWTRKMRKVHREYEAGVRSEAEYERMWEKLETRVKKECKAREYRLRKLQEGFGEFRDQASETKGGVMSTIMNKFEKFRDRDLNRAFSRDEIQPDWITSRPCLFLVGAPMRKKDTGALFVASILSNMAIKSVFTRAAVMDTGEGEAWMGGVHFVLDELPQLNVTRLIEALATFRGYRGAIYGAWQERAQMKTQYGEDVTTAEGNMKTQVTLPGLHIETSKHYADTLGEVNILKESESMSGGEKTVSRSVERVPLMNASDVHEMRINGRPNRELALITGGITPPFLVRVLPFFADPVVRRLLSLKRAVKKPGRLIERWMFWRWEDRWEPEDTSLDSLYLRRTDPEPGDPTDPVRMRQEDPYDMYVEYLVGKPVEEVEVDGRKIRRPVYDAFQEADLDLDLVTKKQSSPQATTSGFAPKPGGRSSSSAKAAEQGIPQYRKDVERAVHRDTRPPSILEDEGLPEGGSCSERAFTDSNTS